MNTVMSFTSALDQRVRQAMAAVLPGGAAEAADPQIRPSDHADFQANGVLPLARPLKANPRELAAKVATGLAGDDLIANCEVSGPGFLNLTIAGQAIWKQLGSRRGEPRLGIPATDPGTITVIDYSQPNIAKEMHVGHLRSTVIGDALARILEFNGAKVIRHNHIGDWGTQFGMLIQFMLEEPQGQLAVGQGESGEEAISRLDALYRASRKKFDSDPEFAGRARERVVALQAGDPETVAGWQDIVAESKIYFEAVYERLGVLLTDEDAIGESFYNPFLQEVCTDLEERGIAVRSDGALCVFFDDIPGPDGTPAPLIVQKSDGGFGYATTDLAAIRYRAGTLHAKRILYVVDARQALHFRMVFETARRAGYLPGDVEAIHVGFGTVLGTDGRPFKTRAGGTIKLISLLGEAVDRAAGTVAEKDPALDADALARQSADVGIGAVKYADLSTGRTRDYVFDLDRMVSLQGNTSVYLQYANARIQSILRKAPQTALAAKISPDVPLEPAERKLAMQLDGLADALAAVREHYEPHRLCAYLYALAQAFTEFYETCPVIKAPTVGLIANRVALCQLTSDTLELGLGLLGIAAPGQL
jgi:arginyl-tRNA synthetase